MNDFEEVGRSQIIKMINSLEEAAPGWIPMFYHTASYKGDIAEANRLREEFDLPRSEERQNEIDQCLVEYEEAKQEWEVRRDLHEERKQTEWLYWLACALGFRKFE